MSDKKKAIVKEAQQRTVQSHQPGQDVFRSILSEDIEWKPFAAFPPSVRLAVVVGHPSEAAPGSGKFPRMDSPALVAKYRTTLARHELSCRGPKQ